MSTLYLVRHGQASFGQSNYDKLSDAGAEQCVALGRFWASRGMRLDAVYAGDLVRQTESAELVRAEYEKAGLSFPPTRILAGFNEYDAQAILTGSLPDVLAGHPEIAVLLKDISPEGKPDLAGNRKTFQRVFAKVMDLWVAGRLFAEGMESWPEFVNRVNSAIDEVVSSAGSGTVAAVFTSGGSISVAVQRALKTPDREALELGWLIKNASITEFRFSGERFSLAGFNCIPHLDRPELITYR